MTAFTHRRPLRQSFILLALLLALASWLGLQKQAVDNVKPPEKSRHEQANTVPSIRQVSTAPACKQVRQVYHGRLTYAANWSSEYQQIRFWDALDFVGIQAYFPLSAVPNPPLDTLLRGWQPHLRALAAFQKKVKKPLVFTKIGYKATTDAAARPWEWPERALTVTPADEATQARCYEALSRACWGQSWLKGLFIWKWYPGLAANGPARRHADCTPQHKPAEAVLGRWFAQ